VQTQLHFIYLTGNFA